VHHYGATVVQSEVDETAPLSQHEQDLLSRLSPDVVCQLIDSVFNELVAEFKVLAYLLYTMRVE